MQDSSSQEQRQSGLRISTFDVDATPPVGDFMPYGRVINTWDMGCRAKGIVILGSGQPIVLCAFDWGCIGNDAFDAFRNALAHAAETTPERVAVHTLHQHDAPWADFSIERILRNAGIDPNYFDSTFPKEVMRRLETAVSNSLKFTKPVTHIGLGEAQVYMVASNRRVFDSDGKIMPMRVSACKDPVLREKPEGVIDPMVSLISFWNGDKPVAVLSYYATHPQSYYRTGIPNPDFPGIARFLRQLAVPDALHIHFAGAAGNVAAGKYNDGSHENRMILAERLADGMKRAWETTKKEPVSAKDVSWAILPVALPTTTFEEKLEQGKKIESGMHTEAIAARIAFQERSKMGKKIDITCLKIGRSRILHLPGELFVEYQIAAKKMRTDLFVTMASFGDYGPIYIGTEIAYKEGGYETGHEWSYVTPEVEGVLMAAIRKLLND